jgi:hypothetical protein
MEAKTQKRDPAMASPEAEKFKALGNEALAARLLPPRVSSSSEHVQWCMWCMDSRHSQAKNYEEAIRNYNKAITLDPENAVRKLDCCRRHQRHCRHRPRWRRPSPASGDL